MTDQNNTREVIVIDAGVGDWKTLTAGLSPDIPVVLLPPGGNGLAALAEALAGFGELSALHLVSHGGTGRLSLGDLNLTSGNLGQQGESLAAIASHFTAGGDLLLYGCSVAGGETGLAFVQALSAALGGIDIAASTDRTGPLALGGDWDLEYATGTIESVLPFTVRGMQGIDQCLGCYSAYTSTYMPPCGGGGDITPPTVSNVNSSTANGAYKAGDVISIRVNFSETVLVTGTPQLTLETGSTDRVVNYTSGSNSSTLIFNYTVQAGDTSADLDYRNTTALALNGGTIKDAAGNNATLTLASPGAANSLGANKAIVIDTTAPTVSSVTSSTANGTYKAGDTVSLQVNFSETVTVTGTPQLTLETGSTDRVVNYASGSGSSTLTFTYTVQAGDTTADLDYLGTTALALNGGTIKDAAGNNATLTLATPGAANSLGANKNIVIDGVVPTVASVDSSTANGSYKVGDTVSIQVNFSEAVTVTGTPQLTLETGSTDRVVNYASGSGTSALTFTYTVQAGDTTADLDYLSTTALALNGGTIKDAAGNDATLTLAAPGAANSLGANQAIVIDGVAPTVASVNSSSANGSYQAGDTISIQVNFSEAVTVTGTPQLTLETGSTDQVLNYASGSGTSTLTFSYTVQAGDTSADLDYLNTTALALNGGTIKDAVGNDATLTLANPGAANSLGSNQAIVIDTTAPTVASVNSSTANGSYQVGDTISIQVNFNEAVSVTGTPQLTLETGSTDRVVDYASGSGSSTLTFTYTVQAGDTAADLDYLGTTALALNGGTIKDAAGNDATLTLASPGAANSLGANKAIVIDTTPSITSATYDASTGVLTVTGQNFAALSGAANDIAVSKLTLQGEGGSSYTLTSADVEIGSATTFSVSLNAPDRAAVNLFINKNGTASTDATTYNLAAAEDWAAGADSAVVVADLTGNGITASNVAVPAITSATYDANTGTLVVTGTGFLAKSGATNDIDISKLSIAGDSTAYTLTSASVEITSATSFTVTLNGTDKTALATRINKDGSSSLGSVTYNLAAAEDWAAGADSAVVVADLTGNGITASNASLSITSAVYDVATGVLSVTGAHMTAGDSIDISKLTLTGEGGATYTLTSGNVTAASATAFTVALNSTDQAALQLILNKNGTSSTGGTTFNLAGAANWDSTAGSGADLSGNAVTVGNVAVPAITGATYDASTGTLVVAGSGFLKLSGAANDIVASKFSFTGEGGSTYTLTDSANVEIASGTAFTLTLSATDQAAINQIVNKNGTASTDSTTYNFAAAEDWAAGADAAVVVADLTGNGITASNVAAPTITSATYNAGTGTLVVTGTGFLAKSGAANDIVASKFSFTGEGGSTYTLTDSANVEITSGTAFTLTLSATDQAAINQIVNKNGSASTGATTYNLAAAEDWAAGADAAVVVADLTGNGLTASNVAVPTITSATYNAHTGTLVVTGTGFLKLSGAANDIDVTKLSIAGDSTAYTLTSTSVEIASATSFTVSLNATDIAALATRLNQDGSSSLGNVTYNLAAAEDWAAGADAATTSADLNGNGITATLNTSPTITSNGGGAAAALNLAENQTAVTTVIASDADSDPLSYSLTGGTDQAKFAINAGTGVLSFVAAPDFEAPGDSDSNNSYVVQVTASDGHGGTDIQTITVMVTDVDESSPPAPGQTVDGVTVTQSTQTTASGETLTTLTVPVVTATRTEDQSTNSTLADIPLATSSDGKTLLQVSLPVGVGLSSQSIGKPGQSLRDQLIAASNPKIGDSTVFTEILANGIDQYLPSVTDPQQVTVRTVTFAGTDTVPSAPIILTGALGAGEDSPQNPSRQEALIIDARNLPSGTVLEFDNVEFAIVIGAARVTGGNGRNFVIGDDAKQFIVLGPEDDDLHGGSGDDTIGSKGGNDMLYGDEGNDHVVGGSGDDSLYGGSGDDVLQGGQSDAGTWNFSLDARRQLVTTFTAGDSELAANATESIIGQWSASNSALTANQMVTFGDQNTSTLEAIALLYHAVLQRAPTLTEMNFWASQGTSDLQLASQVYAKHIAGQHFASQQAQAAELFTWLWGSEVVDTPLLQAAEKYLNDGGNWGELLLYGLRQPDFRHPLEDADGNLALIQSSSSTETGWSTDTGNDTLDGGDGNDLLVGGGGNDTLDGGAGLDTAGYSSNAAGYTITKTATGYSVGAANGDVDSLSGIERLRFADKRVALDVDPSGHTGQALEFIGALAFGLKNNAAAVGNVLTLFDQGKSLHEVFELALRQGVVRDLAGSDSNFDLARLVYRNVTGHEASSEQASALAANLQGSGGTLSQADFLTAVAQLDLNQQHLDLVGLARTGVEFV